MKKTLMGIFNYITLSIITIVCFPLVIRRFLNCEVISGIDDKRVIRHYFTEILNRNNWSSTWGLGCQIDKWLSKRLVRYVDVSLEMFKHDDEYIKEMKELKALVLKWKFHKTTGAEYGEEFDKDYTRYIELLHKYIIGKAWW